MKNKTFALIALGFILSASFVDAQRSATFDNVYAFYSRVRETFEKHSFYAKGLAQYNQNFEDKTLYIHFLARHIAYENAIYTLDDIHNNP